MTVLRKGAQLEREVHPSADELITRFATQPQALQVRPPALRWETRLGAVGKETVLRLEGISPGAIRSRAPEDPAGRCVDHSRWSASCWGSGSRFPRWCESLSFRRRRPTSWMPGRRY